MTSLQEWDGYKKILILVIILSSVFVSCKKDKDELPPEITITLPAEGTYFDVLDTITISAIVTDETTLEYIKVQLVDENLIPVLNTVSIYPESKTYDINIDYPIYDKMLEGGKYYILVQAMDGSNTTNLYRRINIDAIPLKYQYLCVITKSGSSTVPVYKVDSSFTSTYKFTADMDYAASMVNSKYDYLAIAGRYIDGVNLYNLTTCTQQGSTIPSGVGNPDNFYFENLYLNDWLYVSFYSGKIDAFDDNSSLQLRINLDNSIHSDFYPAKIIKIDNYLVMELKDVYNTYKYLAVYYYSSQVFWHQKLIDYSVVELFEKGDSVIVFANNDNTGIINIYSIDGNTLSEPVSVPSGFIYSVAQVDETNFLIAHETGILKFNSYDKSLSSFKTGIQPGKIAYESLSGYVYTAESNEVKAYLYPGGTFINSVTVPDSIVNIHLVYNK